jgi:hypothetical protein
MHSRFSSPPIPKYFATPSLYQDVPGLQFLERTYPGIVSDSRLKVCLILHLNFSNFFKNRAAGFDCRRSVWVFWGDCVEINSRPAMRKTGVLGGFCRDLGRFLS